MNNIHRGDIWWVNLDPTQGSEIRKTRPCLVLTTDTLNRLRRTVVVVPLSSSPQAHPPISVAIKCENKSAVAVIDQIRAVGKHRLTSRIETASKKDLDTITDALSSILEMG